MTPHVIPTMIHPTELLRTNSEDEEHSFSAPVGNYLNQVDCGIGALPCLTKCLRLEKCAKFGVFVAVLSLVGLFHGAILVYFRGTSHIWGEHYNISQDAVGMTHLIASRKYLDADFVIYILHKVWLSTFILF